MSRMLPVHPAPKETPVSGNRPETGVFGLLANDLARIIKPSPEAYQRFGASEVKPRPRHGFGTGRKKFTTLP